MKNFQFRLATALRLREMQYQLEQTKLTQLLVEEQKMKNLLNAIQAERETELLHVHKARELNSMELRTLSSYLVGFESRKLELQNSLARQARLTQEQRARVIRAQRTVRLLVKLREKKLREWTLEAEREIEAIAQDSWLAAHRPNARPN